MAATKLARRIVVNESPIAMTDAFLKGMQERTTAILEGLKPELSISILLKEKNEPVETRIDSAIDYVIRKVNESGINFIGEAIEKSANLFSIDEADLKALFESAIADEVEPIQEDVDYNKFEQSFLSKLDNILEQNSGNILGFLDTTSAYVTPQEGKALVEVYSQLNTENKKKLVERLISSKREFNSLLGFAVSIHEGKTND